MPELIYPTVDLRDSWLAARDEWGRGAQQPGSGLRPDDQVDTDAGFSAWVRRLANERDTALAPAEGRVHADYWWIVEDQTYLGAITLRHALNAFLLRAGGHVGYGLRPSARGRGLAAWALRSILPRAQQLGLARVLVTCEDANVASARTIEKAGGVLEDIRQTELGVTRRYWITLPSVNAGR
jgi:predicted acetyltransferase